MPILKRHNTPIFLFLITGSVYFATRAPGLSWKFGGTDGGELATAVHLGGIAHPSGYPLYVILGKIFTTLLFFEPSALSIFSAVTMASGMAFLFCAAAKLLPDAHPLLLTGSILTFAFLRLTWSQAVIIEVYSLTLMLWAVILWLAASDKPYWLSFIMGLSLGNHLIIFLGFPGIFVWWPSLHRRQLTVMVLLFLLGTSVYLWLPLRDVPASSWGNPDSWERFHQHITGEIYRDYQFKGDYRTHFITWLTEIGRGFGPLLLLLPIGVWHFWKNNRPFLLGSLLSFICIGFYRLGYAAEGVDAYWLLPNTLLTLWISAGVYKWFSILPQRWVWLIFIFPLVLLIIHFDDMNLRHDRQPETFVKNVLLPLPENAVLLTDDEKETFTLWYAIHVKKQRPDVWIIDVRMMQWGWYVDNLTRLYGDLRPLPEGYVTLSELIEAVPEERPIFSRFPVDPSLTQKTIFIAEGW